MPRMPAPRVGVRGRAYGCHRLRVGATRSLQPSGSGSLRVHDPVLFLAPLGPSRVAGDRRSRMSFGRLIGGVLLGLWLAAVGAQAADDYPARPIKIVVPYAVGGATDLITRVVAQSLSASLGVGVVV